MKQGVPHYITPSATKWHTFSDSMKPYETDIEWKMLEIALQSNSSNCLMLIPQKQLRNYMLSNGETYGLTAQHVHKTL